MPDASDERRRRDKRRQRGAKRRSPAGRAQAQTALHHVAQHQGDPNRQHAGWRHHARRHRNQTGPIRDADRADMQDQPVRQRDTRQEPDKRGDPAKCGATARVGIKVSDRRRFRPDCRPDRGNRPTGSGRARRPARPALHDRHAAIVQMADHLIRRRGGDEAQIARAGLMRRPVGQE